MQIYESWTIIGDWPGREISISEIVRDFGQNLFKTFVHIVRRMYV